jgi:hypothetical protein
VAHRLAPPASVVRCTTRLHQDLGGLETLKEEDVGMLELGRRRDLFDEAVAADDRGELGPEHLDRDFAVVFQVIRRIDGGHAPPELAVEPVATVRAALSRVTA